MFDAYVNKSKICTSLTSAHFLFGRFITEFPETYYFDVPINYKRYYQIIYLVTRKCWQRCHKEYLLDTASLLKGDLVLVEEPNIPPIVWPLGRFITTHPGKDEVEQPRRTKPN